MRRITTRHLPIVLLCLVVLVGVLAAVGLRPVTRRAPQADASQSEAVEEKLPATPDEPEPSADIIDLGSEDDADAKVEEEWLPRADADILEGDEVYEGEPEGEQAPAVPADDEGTETDADAADEQGQAPWSEGSERLFSMPEQADYEPEVALVSVPEGMTARELNDVLAGTPSVADVTLSDDDVASGLVKVPLAPGVSVEDAVNDLLATGAVRSAQPNYRYVSAAVRGDASDLVRLLSRASNVTAALSADTSHEDAGQRTPADERALVASASHDTHDEGEDAGVAASAEPEEGAGNETGADARDDDARGAAATDAGGDASPDEGAADSGTDPVAPGPDDPVQDEGADTPEQSSPDDAQAGQDADTPAEVADGQEGPSEGGQDAEEGEPLEQEDETASDEGDAKKLEGAAALATDLVNDPKASNQWELASVRAPDAWNLAKTEGAVTVAILDEGFNVAHEDLKANVVAGYNSVTGGTNVDLCYSDHGNHVAGLVAARANNGKGIAGVSHNAGILLVEVAEETEEGLQADTVSLVRAFNYVIAQKDKYNIRVINLSMNMVGKADWLVPDDEVLAMVDEARAAGIVTVAAAGNKGPASTPYVSYPSDYETVVSVINITQARQRSSGSNYNLPGSTAKNISAPGTNLVSTLHDEATYGTMTGTSMATPVVSAVLALEFAAGPSLSADQAVRVLYDTATDIGEQGWDLETGYGEVNAYQAIAYVRQGAIEGPSYLAKGSSGRYYMVGSDRSFTYTSSDTGVASITSEGRVTATGAGTTTITATSDDGVIVRTATLTVFSDITGPDTLAVPSSATLKVSEPEALSWTWTSSNTAVAKVGASSGVVTGVAPGTATITAKLDVDPSVTLTKTVTVTQGNIANATISAIADKTYTGKAITPVPTVKMGSTKLVNGTDYTLRYANNKAIGTATIKITGTGSYTGSKKVTFAVVGVKPAANLTGWHSPDLGKTYYWYSKGKQRTKAGWVVTKLLPKGGSSAGKERYWLGKGGVLAMSRLVKPTEGDGAYYAYARSTGYVVRGRYKMGTRVYLADNDGKLLSPGWHVSSDFGQGKRRYYVEKSTRSAVRGYSASGYAHYTTKYGYVLLGAGRAGSIVYLANAKTGKLPAKAGWYVGEAYGQGVQRYYFHKLSSGAYAAKVGYSKAGYKHYTTKKGYVLRGTLKAPDGYTYTANDDGLVTKRKKS